MDRGEQDSAKDQVEKSLEGQATPRPSEMGEEDPGRETAAALVTFQTADTSLNSPSRGRTCYCRNENSRVGKYEEKCKIYPYHVT